MMAGHGIVVLCSCKKKFNILLTIFLFRHTVDSYNIGMVVQDLNMKSVILSYL